MGAIPGARAPTRKFRYTHVLLVQDLLGTQEENPVRRSATRDDSSDLEGRFGEVEK